MIKKIVLVLLLLFCLSGCKRDIIDFKSSINLALQKACAEDIPGVENNNCVKPYYTYYLDKNIGKLDGDEISNQFKICGNLSSLSLDISSITLNHIESDADKNTLRDIGTLENLVYSHSGRFYNSNNEMVNYRLSIAEIDSNNYVALIQTPYFIFISEITNGTCANTIHDMIVLLRTCTIDDMEIVYDYASENIVSATENVITLFHQIIPESGYIIDYMNDWKDDKTFITIDKVEVTDDPTQDYSETYEDGENDSEEPRGDDEDDDY